MLGATRPNASRPRCVAVWLSPAARTTRVRQVNQEALIGCAEVTAQVRLPAVAGRFYPADPEELTRLVRRYAAPDPQIKPERVTACLVPHAGYMYSGHVAGAVFSRIALPQKIIILSSGAIK